VALSHLCFVLAFHAYGLGAIAYLALLAGRRGGMVWTARVLTLVGWVLQGIGLGLLLAGQGWRPHGFAEGLSVLCFLLVALFLAIELRTHAPVLGAFLAPAAVAVWLPALWVPAGEPPNTGPWTPLLVAHIGVALTGLAVFGVATGVAVAFLLLERQVKGKRFGVLFERLPSLELLDGLNRRLVTWGFVALSLTLVTGLGVAARSADARAFQGVELTTAVAWLVFAGLLQARVLAGWRGRRVAWLTMAGFGLLILSFVGTYGAGGSR
jgi:ABC-type uncharacterized transport system permease subunit